MNPLVAYGGDSDEESPSRSPLPHVSDSHPETADVDMEDESQERAEVRRKESDLWDEDVFATADLSDRSNASGQMSPGSSPRFEPPPPPRGHDGTDLSPPTAYASPLKASGFPKVSSTLSLVSYDGEKDEVGKEDAFARYDREHPNEPPHKEQSEHGIRTSPPSIERRSRSRSRSHSVSGRRNRSSRSRSSGQRAVEPRPPGRQSLSDNEDDIDKMVAEAMKVVKEVSEMDASPGGSGTPTMGSPSREQMELLSGPDRVEGEVIIPEDAEEECDPAVLKKFEYFFQRKADGEDMNAVIQRRKDFMNPSIYTTFIERYHIDEKGTNFPPSLFNPHGFPEDCYYDKLAAVQNKLMEKTEAHQVHKAVKK